MSRPAFPTVRISPLFHAAALALGLAAAAAAPAHAATVTAGSSPGCDFTLSGAIEPGDELAFRILEAAHRVEFGAPARMLCLDSPGGNYLEARKISRIVNSEAIGTRLTAGADCLSACTVVFLAGFERSWDYGAPLRKMHVTANLGFHAPFVAVDPGAALSGAQVNAFLPEYNALLSDLLRFTIGSSSRAGMPMVSPRLLIQSLDTPPDEMLMIDTVGRAARMGVILEGLPPTRTLSTTDLAQGCLNELFFLRDSEAEDITRAVPKSWQETTTRDAQGRRIFQVDFYGELNDGCRFRIPSATLAEIEGCVRDLTSATQLGFCGAEQVPWRMPWWHVLPPTTLLASLAPGGPAGPDRRAEGMGAGTVFTAGLVHLGDEEIGDWPALHGTCIDFRVPAIAEGFGLAVEFEPYGMERAYLDIDGARHSYHAQDLRGQTRPNYWGYNQYFYIGGAGPTPARSGRLCADVIPSRNGQVDFDDLMIRNLTVQIVPGRG